MKISKWRENKHFKKVFPSFPGDNKFKECYKEAEKGREAYK